MKLTHGRAVLLMVAVTFMWATAGVATRHLEQARSFEVTFWRAFFALSALLVILPLWQGRVVFSKICNGSFSLWVSGVCWCVMFTAYMVALTMTSVANVLITMALGPLMTALASRLFIGHRLPPHAWGAIVLAGCGIGWMYVGQLGHGVLTGTLVALCVPVAGACNWTVVQHAHAKGHDIDLAPAVLIGAALCTLIMLPLAWPFLATPHDLGLLAALGAFQLAIPCVLAVSCARILTAPEVSLLAVLEVIFGIALAWLGADEVPANNVFTGGALVIAALVGNEWLGMRERRTTLPAVA